MFEGSKKPAANKANGGDLREKKTQNENGCSVSHFSFQVLANSGYVLKLNRRKNIYVKIYKKSNNKILESYK